MAALGPCIFPWIVPVFVFFTQPVIPLAMQLSRQCFVNPQPEKDEHDYLFTCATSINHLAHLALVRRSQTPPTRIIALVPRPRPLYMLAGIYWVEGLWSRRQKNTFTLPDCWSINRSIDGCLSSEWEKTLRVCFCIGLSRRRASGLILRLTCVLLLVVVALLSEFVSRPNLRIK